MAPEQVRGVRNLTPATDIFALGCVLYKCLTGEPAFSADQVAVLLVRILFEEPIPLSQRRPEIPASISLLLRRMLHKDPGQRIANAGELVLALATLGDLSETTGAGIHAAPSPPSGFARSEQLLYSMVAASLLPPGESGEVAALGTQPRSRSSPEQELISELRTLGLRADFIVGGLLVVTVPPSGTANDQAAKAARVGLMIKERWPRAVVAVATGRGAAQGSSTVGEVDDRAMQLLQSGGSHQQGALAKGQSGVWLDALSARLLSTRFSVVSVDDQSLLLSEEKEADASRPLLGKPTQCVGRDAELGMLEGQLVGCTEDSEPRAILVTASPGMGKSRLRHEFLRRVEKLNIAVSVWFGRADPMRTDSAYSLLGDTIRRVCGLTGRETPAVERQSLSERVGLNLDDATPADKERILLFVAELCGIPFPEEGKPMLGAARQDPKILRERIGRAFLDFLAAECAVTPILLVVDDLQWADALSVSLIDEALHERKGSPLCVLALARPEVHQTIPGLWQAHKPQEIQLKALARKPCERLIQQVLGKQVPPEVMARIVDQAAGNALFLEELIRAVAEGKTDSQADTVVAMLQVRIGRFEPTSRRALQAAAVFGQTFWLGGVAMILGVPKTAPEVTNWLTALVTAEVIETHPATRVADDREYSFRHGLVRDASYGLLTDEDKQTGHQLAGEFLQAADCRDPAVIAEHYELGKEPARAAQFYARAAEQALSNSDNKSALSQVERGLACGATDDTLAILRSVELAVWQRQNRFDRLYELVPAALSLARPGTRAWSRILSVAVVAATLGPLELRARRPQLIQMLLGADPQPDARVAYAEALGSMAIALATDAPKHWCDRSLAVCALWSVCWPRAIRPFSAGSSGPTIKTSTTASPSPTAPCLAPRKESATRR